MLAGLTLLHNSNRYLILGFIIIALVDTIIAMAGGKGYTKSSKIFAVIALIFGHILLLLGLALYFMGDKGINHILNTEEFMGIAAARFYAVDHLVGMLIGITLVTVEYLNAKRIEESAKKYKTILTYFGIGLIIIFVMIPWPFIKEFGSWI